MSRTTSTPSAGPRRLLSAVALCALLGPAAAQPAPLLRAHAHNDYAHARPLLDALDRGFCSVEADVHLVDGVLLVAHDREDVRPERTLEALYLAPLRARAMRNGGRVYPGGPSLLLLVDIKSEAEATYAALREVLGRYADILTRFTIDTVEEGAVTVVVSGNRPRATMAAEPVRLAAYDGRLEDLTASPDVSPAFIPLVSSNWSAIAPWYGTGPLPEEARQHLQAVVETAHAQGRRIRFWATTDRPVVWTVLYEAGVDLLNADDLDALAAFLRGKEGR